MKKIKSFFGITAGLVAIMLLALACNDDMDINKVYAFDLVCMPVQKKIVQGEVDYTSHCTDQQVIDVYIEDNHGQVVQKTFSFQNDKGEDEDETDKTE